MRIFEFEKHFKDPKNLEKALIELEADFNKVDYYAGLMKNNITDNAEEAKKALDDLTGVYMLLKTALAIAETWKKNLEIRKYDTLRIAVGQTEKKFVSTTAEKEASAFVADYRRVRNIISAYVNSCQVAISTLQSILKAITEEMKLQK